MRNIISNREHKSLGLPVLGNLGQKRKQGISLDKPAPKKVHMDSQAIFEEFSLKVNQVLQCPDRRVVLQALRDLAEGKEAILPNDAVLEPLSGLRQNLSKDDGVYKQTMAKLLTWGLRSFPIQLSREPPLSDRSSDVCSFYDSMALIDGFTGYAQYLFTIFHSQSQTPFGFVSRMVWPHAFISDERQPRPPQPIDEDLQYVVDYLANSPDARAVLATVSRFGWKNLSVDCVCLYVEADSMADLADVAGSRERLTVLVQAELRPLASSIEVAKEMVNPPGLDRLASSKRRFTLRKNPTPRAIDCIGPFHHGQSISVLGEDSKCSVAVFLSPEGPIENDTFALAAYHVLPMKTADGPRVMTPAGLDVVSCSMRVLNGRSIDEEKLDFLLERWNQECGRVEYGRIGVNKNGWRDDWTLVRLYDQWKGLNGSWVFSDELSDLVHITERRNNAFTGGCGVLDVADAMTGDICYKDGASTGATAGRVDPIIPEYFEKGTANQASGQDSPAKVDRCTLLRIEEVGENRFCDSGDSGSGVFTPDFDKDSWNWVGQLVSRGPNFGLMVPATEIMRSIQEVTGMNWKLSR